GAGLGRGYRAIAGRRVQHPMAIAATLGFVLATAPIFIHCLDRVVDFHRDLGGWVLRTVRSNQERSNTSLPASRIATGMVDRHDRDLAVVYSIDDCIGEPTDDLL